MENGAHITCIIMIVQITTRLRIVQKVRRTYLNDQTKSQALCFEHGLYKMGLYETVCFMMVNSHIVQKVRRTYLNGQTKSFALCLAYVFDISKGHAQVVSKDLNTKSYMAEACSECP